ncbi:MerC domain-containing protein [Ascidiimonas aurantiaca]|uniref:MerC domain-containing protein n=1 Tax=Ascidiimonas aurantiaca TaxID=1685432 RepID=UPI0030ED2AB5
MVNWLNFSSRSDIIGIIASSLCFLHCLATPFLFVAYTGTSIIEETHTWWWGTLDLIFLVISFLAIYWSARVTSSKWIKHAFWYAWLFLSLLIVNEKLEVWHLPEWIIYLPAIGLIALHFYNHRYCRCKGENCCIDH